MYKDASSEKEMEIDSDWHLWKSPATFFFSDIPPIDLEKYSTPKDTT